MSFDKDTKPLISSKIRRELVNVRFIDIFKQRLTFNYSQRLPLAFTKKGQNSTKQVLKYFDRKAK